MDRPLLVESIKNLCKKNGITTTKLEELLGFSQGLIGRWKDKSPTLDRIIDIADYFHVTLDDVVGRNLNEISDDFLRVLYDKTDSGEVVWHSFGIHADPNVLCPHKKSENFLQEEYDHECQMEIQYYSRINGWYIIIYSFCYVNQSTNPIELKLYIQPSDDSDLVIQPYSMDELKTLWIKILNSLENEAPDDVRAEELKNEFINSDSNIDLVIERYENNPQYANRLFSYVFSIDPSLREVIKMMNNPEMQKVLRLYSDPEAMKSITEATKIANLYTKLNIKE